MAAVVAPLAAALTASGGPESAGFINDIVAQLWPNIVVLAETMTKAIAEPMFAEMLPAPLNTLHFVKMNLGSVPLKFGNVDVHKTDLGAIKLDLDVDWDGDCDIELDAKMMPAIGIEKIKLTGRLSILLGPLTNVIPLVRIAYLGIGAAQVAFINPPYLHFTYTNAGAIANVGFIDSNIKKVVMSIMGGMVVLPNRFLVKLDSAADWFKTYQHPLGILRVTIESGSNLGADSAGKGFFKKLATDVADPFVKVNLGEDWKTKVIDNNRNPVWNETHDFLLCDNDQILSIDVEDDDAAGADDLGVASTTIKDLLLNGGNHEFSLTHKGEATEGKIKMNGKFLQFVADPASLNSQDQGTHGLLTVLIANVKNISGEREKLKPSVAVTWGDAKFATGQKADAPGSDIQNPSYDAAFRIPLTAAVTINGAPAVRIALMDGKAERGFVEIPVQDVLAAPNLSLEQEFQLQGDNAIIRAAVVIRGTKLAE